MIEREEVLLRDSVEAGVLLPSATSFMLRTASGRVLQEPISGLGAPLFVES
jgi:hypothetical protein